MIPRYYFNGKKWVKIQDTLFKRTALDIQERIRSYPAYRSNILGPVRPYFDKMMVSLETERKALKEMNE